MVPINNRNKIFWKEKLQNTFNDNFNDNRA